VPWQTTERATYAIIFLDKAEDPHWGNFHKLRAICNRLLMRFQYTKGTTFMSPWAKLPSQNQRYQRRM